MQSAVKEIFDSLADTYANKWPCDAKERARISRIVDAFSLRPGMRVIEAGCGRGDLSPMLLEKIGSEGSLVCLDISDKMLGHTQNALNRYPNFECIQASIDAVPLPDNAADCVVCFNSFPHFENKSKTVAEIARVLKANGLFIVAHSKTRGEINALHKRYGFDMAIHSLPAFAAMQRLLNENNFKIKSFSNISNYLLRAVKQP